MLITVRFSDCYCGVRLEGYALPCWIPQAANRLPDWSSPDDRGIRNMRIKIGDKSGLGAVPGRLTGEGVTCCSERKRDSRTPTDSLISHPVSDWEFILEDYHQVT